MKQQSELVAADTRDHVTRSQPFSQQLSHVGEHVVASPVSETIVNGLEVVEVEKHERQGALVAQRSGDLHSELGIEVRIVVEAGQPIAVSEKLRFL